VDNVNYKLCPNDEEKRKFLEIYLTCYLERDLSNHEVEEILLEIPVFEATSHAFWVIWAIVQANVSLIDFDYLEYAFKRYKQYLKIINNMENSKNH
jgi:ethanolamine kinase